MPGVNVVHEELSGQPKSRVPASVMLPLAVSLDAVAALRSVTVVLVEFKLGLRSPSTCSC